MNQNKRNEIARQGLNINNKYYSHAKLLPVWHLHTYNILKQNQLF